MSAPEPANPADPPTADTASVGADAVPVAGESAPLPPSSGRHDVGQPADCSRFDFRKPSFLAPAGLRQLRRRHEELARTLTARLSTYLRLEFMVRVKDFATPDYQELVTQIPNPAYIGLFRLEPGTGVCLFLVPGSLAIAVVERLLGGAAEAGDAPRELSEIEVALFEQTVAVILEEWCRQWQPTASVRPVLLGHESNPRFLRVAPPETEYICLNLEAGIGVRQEAVTLAFPLAAVEPLFRQFGETGTTPDAARLPISRGGSWHPCLNDVPVRLSAGWPGLGLPFQRLASLRPGDVLLMDSGLASEVQVSIGAVPKFKGRLGRRGPNRAVELLAMTETDNSAKKP